MLILKYIYILCFFVVISPIQSQNNYMTKKGHLKIVTKIDDKNVTIESHELKLFLNYETKQMHGIIDLKKLIQEIPELNNSLENIDGPLELQFTGIIPNTDFMSKPHEALTFNWLVHLSYLDRNLELTLESSLEHAKGGYLTSCRLSTFGEISTEKLGLKKLIPGIDDKIGIRIIQTILKDY